MDGTSSKLCPIVGFSISDTDPLPCTTRDLLTGHYLQTKDVHLMWRSCFHLSVCDLVSATESPDRYF
jgi:hypothetical protein